MTWDKRLIQLGAMAAIVVAIPTLIALNFATVDIIRLPGRFDKMEAHQQKIDEQQQKILINQDINSKNVRLLAKALGVQIFDETTPVGDAPIAPPPVALPEMLAVVPDRLTTSRR